MFLKFFCGFLLLTVATAQSNEIENETLEQGIKRIWSDFNFVVSILKTGVSNGSIPSDVFHDDLKQKVEMTLMNAAQSAIEKTKEEILDIENKARQTEVLPKVDAECMLVINFIAKFENVNLEHIVKQHIHSKVDVMNKVNEVDRVIEMYIRWITKCLHVIGTQAGCMGTIQPSELEGLTECKKDLYIEKMDNILQSEGFSLAEFRNITNNLML